MQKRMSELMGAPWFRELIEKLERFRGRDMHALKGEASVALDLKKAASEVHPRGRKVR